MIELKKLTRRFGNLVAVDRVTLSIPAGQICGYLGPNGAGKTTTVKMLTGLIQPTDGLALVAGYDIQKNSREVKKRIGYVPESGALYQSLTPFEYLALIGRLYRMDETALNKRIEEFVDFFQLDHLMFAANRQPSDRAHSYNRFFGFFSSRIVGLRSIIQVESPQN